MQSWPTAYWPDGSIKWTAHAVPANVNLGEQFKVEKGQPSTAKKSVIVIDTDEQITVDTGVINCTLLKTGQHIIERLSRNGKTIAKKMRGWSVYAKIERKVNLKILPILSNLNQS